MLKSRLFKSSLRGHPILLMTGKCPFFGYVSVRVEAISISLLSTITLTVPNAVFIFFMFNFFFLANSIALT